MSKFYKKTGPQYVQTSNPSPKLSIWESVQKKPLSTSQVLMKTSAHIYSFLLHNGCYTQSLNVKDHNFLSTPFTLSRKAQWSKGLSFLKLYSFSNVLGGYVGQFSGTLKAKYSSVTKIKSKKAMFGNGSTLWWKEGLRPRWPFVHQLQLPSVSTAHGWHLCRPGITTAPAVSPF